MLHEHTEAEPKVLPQLLHGFLPLEYAPVPTDLSRLSHYLNDMGAPSVPFRTKKPQRGEPQINANKRKSEKTFKEPRNPGKEKKQAPKCKYLPLSFFSQEDRKVRQGLSEDSLCGLFV
jgi:hypothetical protein